MPEPTAYNGPHGELWSVDLGTDVPYAAALALQHRVRDARSAGRIPDTVICLEHRPVYTCGRRAGSEDLPLPQEWYAERGIEIVAVDRGGRVTYHGPGQVVLYPICVASNVRRFVAQLEQTMVALLGEYRVMARGRSTEGIEYTGVWVQSRKVGSIGLRIRGGISTHGLALNVSGSLDPFSWIVTCGLPDVTMTSLAAELGDRQAPPPTAVVRRRLAELLADTLGVRCRTVTVAELDHALGYGHTAVGRLK